TSVQRRDALAAAVAKGYASADPDGALEWARRAGQGFPKALGTVLAKIDETDVERAFQVMLSGQTHAERLTLLRSVVESFSMEDASPAQFAEKILALSESSLRDDGMRTIAMRWVDDDARGAFGWLMENQRRM